MTYTAAFLAPSLANYNSFKIVISIAAELHWRTGFECHVVDAFSFPLARFYDFYQHVQWQIVIKLNYDWSFYEARQFVRVFVDAVGNCASVA